jgi:hypothetical protein
MKWAFPICVVVACCVSGCGIRERQERIAAESEAGARLVKLFWLYEDQFPTQPRTNLAGLFDTVGTGYPSDLHERFRRFGRNAGFSNSFYEKYVFVPPGISNAVTGGEMILMSAASFPEEDGREVRVVIFRNGFGYDGWGQKWLPEEVVREIFATAKVEFPKPVPLPRQAVEARYSQNLWQRIQTESGDWARFLGLGRSKMVGSDSVLWRVRVTRCFLPFHLVWTPAPRLRLSSNPAGC